jgi:hypothetical protein
VTGGRRVEAVRTVLKSLALAKFDPQPGRLLVVGLAAVAGFALLVSLVSATEWRMAADTRLLAAAGGTMLNLVTGCIVYFAVRMRRAPASEVLDEDLAAQPVQDAARSREDHQHQSELEQAGIAG